MTGSAFNYGRPSLRRQAAPMVDERRGDEREREAESRSERMQRVEQRLEQSPSGQAFLDRIRQL